MDLVTGNRKIYDEHLELMRINQQKSLNKETDCIPVIRNLSVISTETLTRHQVCEYFERFGEIELVQWHEMNHVHYGFVQFKLEESAKSVLSQSNHRIGDIVLEVKAADDSLQPDFEMILRMLDDYCLKEIFLRLKLGALCNVADVCVRFKDAANWAFSENFKSLDFGKIRYTDYMFVENADDVMDKLFENILRNFGSLIHSLNIIDNEKKLELMSRYCANLSNLKQIQFGKIHITKKFAESFRCVFKNLKKLQLVGSTFDEDIGDLFPICTKIEELIVFSDTSAMEIMNNLLISNPKLTMVAIRFPTNLILSMRELNINLIEPRELEIGFDYRLLSNLSMLNELSLCLRYQYISPLLETLVENIPLKSLQLSEGVANIETFQYIYQMKQIKILRLNSIYSTDLNEKHLIKLAKQLPELEILSLDQCSIIANAESLKALISSAKKLKSIEIGMQTEAEIGLDDYNTMLEIVKSRTVKTYLRIKVKGKVDVPEDIRSKNKDWFEISGHVWPHHPQITR